jgi:hypothetical protein
MLLQVSSHPLIGRVDEGYGLHVSQRYTDLMGRLAQLGYNRTLHPPFTEFIVNTYGILKQRPDSYTAQKMDYNNVYVLREVIFSTAPGKLVPDLLLLLSCLSDMARTDRKPLLPAARTSCHPFTTSPFPPLLLPLFSPPAPLPDTSLPVCLNSGFPVVVFQTPLAGRLCPAAWGGCRGCVGRVVRRARSWGPSARRTRENGLASTNANGASGSGSTGGSGMFEQSCGPCSCLILVE